MKTIKYYCITLTIFILSGCQVSPITINFNHLTLPKKPNHALMCPKNVCNIQAHLNSPCYEINVKTLKETLKNYFQSQPRYTLVSESNEQLQYTQHSLIFKFPDIITVQFYAYNKYQSTLAILSYAKYGYYDFGVNEKRILNIVKYLKTKLPICSK